MDAYASPHTYADAVTRAGGRALLIPTADSAQIEPTEWLDDADGIVLTGGPDIDPHRNGQDPHPTVYGIDPVADTLEGGLVEAALDRGLPVLAICRGLQVLNVTLGGTLHQHITDHRGLADHGWPGDVRVVDHAVRIEPGSRLAGALGVETAAVCSIHHQAIDRLADRLVVTARTDDGLVEAVEPADRRGAWVVGVQWHPEWRAGTDEVQERLFAALVAEAVAFGAARRGLSAAPA